MKRAWIVVVVLIILSFIIAINVYSSAVDYFNTSDNFLALPAKQFSNGHYDLSYRSIEEGSEGIYRYHSGFSAAQLPSDMESHYSVIVYRLAGQSFQVYLNNIYIGSSGEFNGENSSIWNGMYRFEFDKSLLKPDNCLELRIVGLYDVGLVDFPIIIGNNIEAAKVYQYYLVVQVWVKAMFLGILICSGVTMFIFYYTFKNNPLRITFLLMAIALGMAIIYFIDFLPIEYIGIDFFLYKKINVTAIFIVMAILTMVYSIQHNRPKWKYLSYATLIISLGGAVFASNMQQFKRWYDMYFILLVLNIGAIGFMIASTQKKAINKRITLTCLFIMLLILVPIQLNNCTGLDSSMFYSTIHIVLLVFILAVIVIVVTEIKALQYSALAENRQLKLLYQKSVTDQLTGLYNYGYMQEYLEKSPPPYTVILFDIDNLKSINDTYGHVVGNQTIIMITDTLKSILPNSAVAGRYGGDEFIVVHSGDHEEIYRTMEALREKIANTELPQVKSKFSISIGMYIVKSHQQADDILDCVDQALYKAKYSGKNCINVYENDV